MSTSALKALAIGHLRGSVMPFTLPFEKGKKLTVIYGENATGKTTICDAFEFLGHGRVGSLEERGLGQTARYWPSVGKTASDVVVTLVTADSTCTAKVSKGEVIVAPVEARPKVEVLRRSHILRLIEARPADRYAAISRFIDVSGIESSEQALRDLIGDLENNRGTAVAIVQQNEEAIGQFWESAGKPGKDAMTWAEQESVRDVSKLPAEQKALTNLRTAYQRIADYPEKIAAASKALEAANAAVAAANQRLQDLVGKAEAGAAEMMGILDAAKPYFAKHPHPGNCPLCESKEKVSGLRERVDTRIQQFALLQKALREKQATDQDAKAAERRLSDLKTELSRDSKAFEAARNGDKWEQKVSLPTQACPAEFTDLAEWIKSTSQLPEEWRKAEARLEAQSQFVNTLKQALKTYKANVKTQKELDKLLPRLKAALDIAASERRKFTDSVLQSIATKVGQLYELVHPGEGHNKISLELDPKRRASLDIGASFAGQSTPPAAYFSQSHLDTLGLCIFLALASEDKQAETTLVLDDVLASVDEPHVERLIEMLHTEVLKFRHCVITTHYRPWKEKLRWGWFQNGQCQFIELTAWTATDGLKLIRSIPDVERLREFLAATPPDVQSVCAKAGVILEAALNFLTLLYGCSVPRRPDGRYTLGDLLPAVNKKLRQALRADVQTGVGAGGAAVYTTIALAPILDELIRIAQVRNVFGAHFNTLSFQLLDADAIGFGKQVLLLMDAITDPEAGWPMSAKSGSYWATAGETRRLHPLQQPT
jgi:hypothetical protein